MAFSDRVTTRRSLCGHANVRPTFHRRLNRRNVRPSFVGSVTRFERCAATRTSPKLATCCRRRSQSDARSAGTGTGVRGNATSRVARAAGPKAVSGTLAASTARPIGMPFLASVPISRLSPPPHFVGPIPPPPFAPPRRWRRWRVRSDRAGPRPATPQRSRPRPSARCPGGSSDRSVASR